VGACRRPRARVEFSDPAPEVRRGRAQVRRRDAAWRRRIERYERGETVMVAFTASAVIDNDGQRSELRCNSHEVRWVDRPVESPVLRRRLLELAHRDFQLVASHMPDSGIRWRTAAESIAARRVVDPAVGEYLDAQRTPPRLRSREQPAGLVRAGLRQRSSQRRPQIAATHAS